MLMKWHQFAPSLIHSTLLVLCQNDTEGLTNPQDKEFERLQWFASVQFWMILTYNKTKRPEILPDLC